MLLKILKKDRRLLLIMFHKQVLINGDNDLKSIIILSVNVEYVLYLKKH